MPMLLLEAELTRRIRFVIRVRKRVCFQWSNRYQIICYSQTI
jgi:hypothetical protein